MNENVKEKRMSIFRFYFRMRGKTKKNAKQKVCRKLTLSSQLWHFASAVRLSCQRLSPINSMVQRDCFQLAMAKEGKIKQQQQHPSIINVVVLCRFLSVLHANESSYCFCFDASRSERNMRCKRCICISFEGCCISGTSVVSVATNNTIQTKHVANVDGRGCLDERNSNYWRHWRSIWRKDAHNSCCLWGGEKEKEGHRRCLLLLLPHLDPLLAQFHNHSYCVKK